MYYKIGERCSIYWNFIVLFDLSNLNFCRSIIISNLRSTLYKYINYNNILYNLNIDYNNYYDKK